MDRDLGPRGSVAGRRDPGGGDPGQAEREGDAADQGDAPGPAMVGHVVGPLRPSTAAGAAG